MLASRLLACRHGPGATPHHRLGRLGVPDGKRTDGGAQAEGGGDEEGHPIGEELGDDMAADQVGGPTSTMAVVSRATPTAPPSWRTALNRVEARPVASAEMVANDAAWVGTNTWPMPSPSANISSRAHQRLAEAPRVEIKAVTTDTVTRPMVM